MSWKSFGAKRNQRKARHWLGERNKNAEENWNNMREDYG